jgi:hypothetical protein
MAGSESDASNALATDFILLGQRLNRLGFVISKEKEIVVEVFGEPRIAFIGIIE